MNHVERVALLLLFYVWGTGWLVAFMYLGAWGLLVFFGPLILIWAARPVLRWNLERMYRNYSKR